MTGDFLTSELKALKFQHSQIEAEIQRQADRIESLQEQVDHYVQASSPEGAEESEVNASLGNAPLEQASESIFDKAKKAARASARSLAPFDNPLFTPIESEEREPAAKESASISADSLEEGKTNEIAKPLVKAEKKTIGFERELGMVWLVRLGIVTLLTGLVFLSNYAYTHFIVEWSAWPRLIGLYFISATFIVLGNFFQKSKESLQNYGAVLAAGGLAALYYTSYAAHHVERLQVIHNPILAGIILTLTALFCLQYALNKNSTITAILSLGLAFYSTSINPVGAFTLASSSVLTVLGLVLFVKLERLAVGFTSLIGAYASYVYWQIAINQGEALPLAPYFIIPYWLLGTAALFLSKPLKESKWAIPFASINNFLFFGLFVINFNKASLIDPIWPVAAIFGAVLIGISMAMRSFDTHKSEMSLCFLGKGLGLITVALITWLSGPSLAVSLAIQASVLFFLANKTKNIVTTVAAFLSMLLSFGFFCHSFDQNAYLTGSLGLIYLFHILLIKKLKHLELETVSVLANIPALFAVLCTAATIQSLYLQANHTVIAFLAAALVYNIPLILKKSSNYIAELPYIAHLLTGSAIVTAVVKADWNSTFLGLVLTVLIAQSALQYFARNQCKGIFHPFYFCLSHFILCAFLHSYLSLDLLILPLALIPLLYHFLSLKVKSKMLIALGLITYLPTWILFALSALKLAPEASELVKILCILAPAAHYALQRFKILSFVPYVSGYLLSGTAFMATVYFSTLTENWYLLTAILGFVYFVCEEKKQFNSLSVIGILSIIWSFLIASSENAPFATRYLITALGLASYFLVRFSDDRKFKSQLSLGFASFAAIAVFITSSQLTSELWSHNGLSICWALLGFSLLSFGLLLKDSTFRTSGFILLGLCLLRVYFVDVWGLHALLRIGSFITLGGVLTLAGYLYCRTPTKEGEHKESDDSRKEP